MNTRCIRPPQAPNSTRLDPSQTAADIRVSLLKALRSSAGATFACYFSYIKHQRTWHIANVCAASAEGRLAPGQASQLARLIDGLASDWSPEFPTRLEARPKFHRLDSTAQRVNSTHQRQVSAELAGAELRDAARLVLYDQEKFLGCIGLFRDKDRFSQAELRQYNRNIRRTKTQLVKAMSLERHQEPLKMIIHANGHSHMTTRESSRWLTSARLATISRALKQLGCSSDTQATALVGGSCVQMSRLQSNKGPSDYYLVSIAAPDPPRLHPTALLTERQREVARLAATGTTCTEVASALGITPETVRDHIKAIYSRLGVGSRIELNELLHSANRPG